MWYKHKEIATVWDITYFPIFLAYYYGTGTKTFFFAFAQENSVTADGQKCRIRTQFMVLQHKKFGVLEIVRYMRRKESCHKAAHSTVGEEPKSTSVRKKKPLTPQVHTADIPQDLRAHMDKSAFFS